MEADREPDNEANRKSGITKEIITTYIIVATLLVSLKPVAIQNYNSTTFAQVGENSFLSIAFLFFIMSSLIYYSIELSKNRSITRYKTVLKNNNYISNISKLIAISFSVILYYCLCETILSYYFFDYKEYHRSIVLSLSMVLIIFMLLLIITKISFDVLDPNYDIEKDSKIKYYRDMNTLFEANYDPKYKFKLIKKIFKMLYYMYKPEISLFTVITAVIFGILIFGTFFLRMKYS